MNKCIRFVILSFVVNMVIIPRHEVEGDIGLGAVRPSVIPSFRHSVRLSQNRFRSITQKLFNISKPNLVYL